MPARPHAIIGREAELRHLEELVDAVDDGPAALLLEGEIGIGKTRLWDEGVSAARSRSRRVLACRPSGSEAALAYAALGDLLAEVPDAAMADLPGPQRHAVEVALLRAEPDEQESPRRAVALGTLGVLRTLARERPTLLAIDDAQWLDPASADALAFVVRRLADERVGLLVARRTDGAAGVPLDLDRAVPEGRFRRVPVGSLSLAELDRVLTGHVGAALPRRTLARLHRASGGNPFYAIEIAKALVGRGDPGELADDLPIPASLHQLVHDRLTSLPAPVREVAQITAALSRPTATLVDRAMGGHGGGGAVDVAVSSGVVELHGEQLRFTHPLLASVAYAQLPSIGRRDLHRRLAAILDDPEERARHLALAADAPDSGVAAALDEAARRAWARGAPDAAAEFAEQARRLTPDSDWERARLRAIAAAERHFETGQVERAQTLLEEVVATTTPSRVRARALARLGWVRGHREGFHVATEVFATALAEPMDDLALRIEIEEGLAWSTHTAHNMDAAREHARTALKLAERLGEPSILAGALSQVAFLDSVAGKGVAMETIERASALGRPPQWSQILGRPDWVHALLLQWAGQLGVARERFWSLYQDATDRGNEHSLPFILYHLARIDLLTGAWDRALGYARDCRDTTLQSGQVGERPYYLLIEALVEAHLGMVEPARDKIAEGLALVEALGVQPAGFELLAVRGFLELSLGEVEQADQTFGQLADGVERTGLREPALFRFNGDAVEAKVALGRADEAGVMLDQLDQLAVALDRTWALMVASRCRGLLHAALGETDAAYQALERAFELHDRMEEPFERARTLLVLGNVQRRDRKKRAARDSLQAALAVFDRLGAMLWSAKARAELARVGGRAPAAGLTPTEERVAQLIAAGHTYRQAADALFISPKTVQWNLSKIYRKLGVRSRAELAARLPAEPSRRGRGDAADQGDRRVPR